jgi:hypothetical protein
MPNAKAQQIFRQKIPNKGLIKAMMRDFQLVDIKKLIVR